MPTPARTRRVARQLFTRSTIAHRTDWLERLRAEFDDPDDFNPQQLDMYYRILNRMDELDVDSLYIDLSQGSYDRRKYES